VSQHRPDHEPDPAFEALRAADPAAHVSPDTTALDAAVRSRLGERPGEQSGEQSGEPSDELAAARSARRPHRWLAVAAVAAGALAVGSAGYALGDRADADLTAAGGETSAVAPAEGGGQGGAVGSAPADARSADAESAASLPWYGGRTVFTAQGLSDEPGRADAWAYDPAPAYSAETAARVATALGLQGEPRLEGGTWTVGPLDGTGPNLALQPDGIASVSYFDPTRDPYGCPAPVPEGDVATEGGGSDPAVIEPDVPACTQTDLGEAPQGDAAAARAREVLTGTGVDPDAYEYEVQDAGTPSAAFVSAHETIGGQRTGMVWSITLVGDGVQSMYGSLAPLVPLGTYDVISENDAVDRLADPRFGPSLGGPVLADDAAVREPAAELTAPDAGVAAPGFPGADGTPPAAVQPGSPFAWPILEVTLTGARLGLAQHTHPDGATVLLPSYELSGDDGSVWSVVAVADSGLDFSSVP
jgi:hypothetical protein